MLAEINRIKKKRDFENIFKKGKTFKNNFLILRVLNNGLDYSRFAFVVSLKVSKKAVVRNKIRRRLRQAVRLNFKNIKNGFDAVFMVLPGGLEKEKFSEVEESVKNLFDKAKIISKL
jgi:ribonuclease P protein component